MSKTTPWQTFQSLMLPRLATILGTAILPKVFRAPHPKALKIGIDRDLLERYPHVDTVELRRWLRWWCSNQFYVAKLATGRHRHDLDGGDIADIDPKVAKRALRMVTRKRAA